MYMTTRCKGQLWQVIVNESVATDVEAYLALRKQQESHRRVSRNEVINEMLAIAAAQIRAREAARGGK